MSASTSRVVGTVVTIALCAAMLMWVGTPTAAAVTEDPAPPLPSEQIADPDLGVSIGPPLTTSPQPDGSSATGSGATDLPAAAGSGDDPADPPGQVIPAEALAIEHEIQAYEQGPSMDLLNNLLRGGLAPRPWSHYDLGASVPALQHIFSHQARLIFSAGMWSTAFASWLLGFVLRFEVGRMLAGSVGALAGQYRDFADGGDGSGLELRELMLLLAIAHAGWQIFRHREQAAVAEIMVALAIAATGGFLLTDVESKACAGLSVMGDLTQGMIDLGSTGKSSSAPRDYCAPVDAEQGSGLDLEGPMFLTFVHEPFLMLQWGVVPKVGTSCRTVAEALVTARSWSDLDQPRQFMQQAGCDDMAAFNAELSADRVAGAAAYAVVAMAFAVAIALAAGTLLVAQVAGALVLLSMPVALVVGIAPGLGRELLVRWGHSVLKVGVLFMGSGFFLALLTTSVRTVQEELDGSSVFVHMLASVVVAWSLIVVRGRIFASMRLGSRIVGAADIAVTMPAGARAATNVIGAATPGARVSQVRGSGPAGVLTRGRHLRRHHDMQVPHRPAAVTRPMRRPSLPQEAT
ncbi:MAG: hypothetical protein ACR2HR_16995 [Euzebya sp.]